MEKLSIVIRMDLSTFNRIKKLFPMTNPRETAASYFERLAEYLKTRK